MHIVFFILAAASILYFAAIALYAGFGASFSFVWIFFAAVFALMGYFCISFKGDPGGLPRRLPYFVFTSFGIAVAVFAFTMQLVVREAVKPRENGADFVIVMGARVYDDGISKSLKYRLDTAYEYYLENPGTIFILSGGKNDNEPVPEAMAMYNYLHLKGMPEHSMIIEMDSLSTLQNVVFSRKKIDDRIIGPWRKPGVYDDVKLGVITNNYHLMRAANICRNQGFTNICGIPAPSDRLLFANNCVRECAAIYKDYLLGNFTWH